MTVEHSGMEDDRNELHFSLNVALCPYTCLRRRLQSEEVSPGEMLE